MPRFPPPCVRRGQRRLCGGARAALTRLIETWRRRPGDSCSPPANSHMFEPGFLPHELGSVLQPGPALCYCWSSARSRAGAAGFLGPIFFGTISSLDFPAHFSPLGVGAKEKKMTAVLIAFFFFFNCRQRTFFFFPAEPTPQIDKQRFLTGKCWLSM